MSTISSRDDIIDVRDVIERVEELESAVEDYENPEGDLEAHDEHQEQLEELALLTGLLDDLKGYGGDEQWRGSWYPLVLIRDSHFEDYAQELAADIGAINRDASWPNNCIDWGQAACELQQDYREVEFEGVTYWYR